MRGTQFLFPFVGFSVIKTLLIEILLAYLLCKFIFCASGKICRVLLRTKFLNGRKHAKKRFPTRDGMRLKSRRGKKFFRVFSSIQKSVSFLLMFANVIKNLLTFYCEWRQPPFYCSFTLFCLLDWKMVPILNSFQIKKVF